MALPSDWISRAKALRGEILVRRARQGYNWQGVIRLPDSYVHGTKNANGLVVDIDEDVDLPIKPGDVVFLAAVVSRVVYFDEPSEPDPIWEHRIYACRPDQILGKLLKEPVFSELSQDPRGRFERPKTDTELQAEEGRADATR